MMADLFVYGAGGFAREVAWLAEQCGHDVLAFIDDAEQAPGREINDIPVMRLSEAVTVRASADVVAAIGDPSAREKVLKNAVAAGLTPATLVHPRVERSRWVTIGAGSVVCAGSILTTNITIGEDVQINLDCTVGHDVVMEDHVTLAPGVHISGWVRLERGAYVGTGANIINGTESAPLVVGARSVIGAGACVTRSIPPGVTAVGMPAKPLVKS